ncbi:Hypothetical predicted protein [Lecanosticta acicola]|uniref:Uncharacterized protein n=1 Tax=Lecanosticta acicola TaxID=111012 RepID=A0AAI9E7T5_9PEZI|nr:Hypothetical predicted protein [Lecanosticta acicola]
MVRVKVLEILALLCLVTADELPQDRLKDSYGKLRQKRQYKSTLTYLQGSSGSSVDNASTAKSLVSGGQVTPPTEPRATFATPTKIITQITYLRSPEIGTVNAGRSVSLYTHKASDVGPARSGNASFTYAPSGYVPSLRPSRGQLPFANGSCGGPTVNILSASMDWWYTKTYTQIDSTFLIQTGLNNSATGWTLLPASTSFDVTDALAAPTCISSPAFNPRANSTMLKYSCWETPTPIAAATTTVDQTIYKRINQTTAKGTIPDVITTPAPAALTLGRNATITAGTAVVHFSKYEIVSARPSRQRNGQVECAESTTTRALNETFSFPYAGQDPNGTEPAEKGIIGGVHFAFLRAIGAETATPGTFSANPTVVVVVEKVVAASTSSNVRGILPPAPSLLTPTATLPSGLSIAQTAPTQTGIVWVPMTAHIESSEAALDVPTPSVQTANDAGVNANGDSVAKPFKARVGSSDITIDIEVNPTAGQSVATALYDGKTVTATALPQSPESSEDDVGRLLSAIGNVAQHGNVAQAGSMVAGTNPTASAIAGIIGAMPGSSSNNENFESVSNTGSGNSGSENAGGSSIGQVSIGNPGANSGSSGPNAAGGSNGNSNDNTYANSIANSNSDSNSNSNAGPGSNSGSGSRQGSESNSGSGSSKQLPVLNIGSSQITAAIAPGQTVSALVLDGQTAVAGGPAITVGDTRVLLAADATAVVIGSSTTNIGVNGRPEKTPVVRIGDTSVTAEIVGTVLPPALVVAGQTASAGGPAITIDGTAVSLPPGGTGVMIGGSTTNIALATPGVGVGAEMTGPGVLPGAVANIPLITIGSETFTANGATQYNIGGSILTPGGSAVVFGTTVSLSPGATQVIINSQTHALSAPVITPAPLVTIDGTVYAPNVGSTYDIGSQHQLLTPDGQIVASGTTVSLASDGAQVFVNGVALSAGASEPGAYSGDDLATITAPPVLTVDGNAFAPNGATAYIISGELLTPGGAVTMIRPDGSRETISLNSAANKLVTASEGVTGTSLIGLMGASPSGAPVLTINGKTYTAVSYDAGSGATYLVNGKPLTPGGSVVLTGSDGLETVSLVQDGTALVSIRSGTTTTSQIPGAYRVLPTAAPILTIGGERFNAINNGATYVINGETLTPGGTDTVVISGHSFVVTLFPHATMLEIQVLGSDSEVISTMFETLFPATMTGTTVYNTRGTTATVGAGATAGSGASATSGNGAVLAGAGSSLAIELSVVSLALGSLALAIWL